MRPTRWIDPSIDGYQLDGSIDQSMNIGVAAGVGVPRAQEQLRAAHRARAWGEGRHLVRRGAQRHDQAFAEAGGGHGGSPVLRGHPVGNILRAGGGQQYPFSLNEVMWGGGQGRAAGQESVLGGEGLHVYSGVLVAGASLQWSDEFGRRTQRQSAAQQAGGRCIA